MPLKEKVEAGKASESPPQDTQVPSKAMCLIQAVQRRGGTTSNMWDSCPK